MSCSHFKNWNALIWCLCIWGIWELARAQEKSCGDDEGRKLKRPQTRSGIINHSFRFIPRVLGWLSQQQFLGRSNQMRSSTKERKTSGYKGLYAATAEHDSSAYLLDLCCTSVVLILLTQTMGLHVCNITDEPYFSITSRTVPVVACTMGVW